MVRKAINLLSPIAALAVVWVSLQSFVAPGAETSPAVTVPSVASTTSVAAPGVLPDLTSISQILADTSTRALDESVPDSVARVLAANGAVLLVPDSPDDGSGL